MIAKVDPRLNLTSSQVIQNEESIHNWVALVMMVSLTLFITGFLCVACKIYEDDEREDLIPGETSSLRRGAPKAPNNTPITCSWNSTDDQ